MYKIYTIFLVFQKCLDVPKFCQNQQNDANGDEIALKNHSDFCEQTPHTKANSYNLI